MNDSVELSLEQQFNLRAFSDRVKTLSEEQSQEFLIELYTHMLQREVVFKELLKQEWDLSSGFAS